MGMATPESQLATLLKEGRAGGFGPLRSEACLRLLAQLEPDAHRNAWFDQFYELWTELNRMPADLRRHYKPTLHARMMAYRLPNSIPALPE